MDMRMTLITLAAVRAGLLLLGSASAAACADYDNQAQDYDTHPRKK